VGEFCSSRGRPHEQQRQQRQVVETALAHVIGDKAEQASRRNDALEKRRKLMEAWAAYCEKPAGNVVHIGKRKLP